MKEALLETQLDLPNRRSGKVRDIYDVTLEKNGDEALLIVATDRVSAFDVVMANGLPGKGVVLTQISKFWFDRFSDQVDHHLLSTDAADIPGISADEREQLDRRIMLCRKTEVVPIRDRLEKPLFTPSTKAETGHDENISFEEGAEIVGPELMGWLRDTTLELYSKARDYALERGIILADTKFEFGQLPGRDEPLLIDEIFTPDSSRFWPADQWQPGGEQPSFDKQIVRNYLEGIVAEGKWDKTPPGPTLPDEVVEKTMARYLEAYERLTGSSLSL